MIFTADHGEVMYGRPGFFDHAGLYDDTVRIPLIMAGSGVPKGALSKVSISTSTWRLRSCHCSGNRSPPP